jgi:hypothetical protein
MKSSSNNKNNDCLIDTVVHNSCKINNKEAKIITKGLAYQV